MNSEILDRYEITSDNRFIIDVNISESGELFERYDENASFYKKDLNERFEEYLLECVEEIGLKNRFIIRIDLPEAQAEKTDEGDIIISFKQFFKYRISAIQKEIKTAFFRMLMHLGLAASALLLLIIFNIAGINSGSKFFNLAGSGLAAAIWVLLLTGFSRFLFRLTTRRSRIKIYRAFKKIPVEFIYKKR